MLTSLTALSIAAGGVALSAVLSTLHLSLRGLAIVTLQDLIEVSAHPANARRARRILDDVDGHAAAISLPRIVANLFVVVGMIEWLTALRQAPGAAPGWPELLLGVAISSVLIWIFGAVIPTSIANHAAERTVYAWALPVRVIYAAARPVMKIVGFFDEIVRRLAGDTDRNQSDVLEAELMSVIEEARSEGQVDEAERSMIEGVVRFKDTTVEQIMTPRTEIEALQVTNNLGELTALIRRVGHSRIPVYEESLDHIVGIFYVKDLMRWLAGGEKSGRGFELRTILRPALFVPETKTIRELLSELLQKKLHIAMVADEYGGTSGLVTIEDIVEEVFGEIWDEYEQPEEGVAVAEVDAKARAADIDARMRIEDANAALRPLGVELPEGEEYDTVGGFILTSLGHIPIVGETIRQGSMLLTVTEAEPTRVNRVRLEVRSLTGPGGGAAGDGPVEPETHRPPNEPRVVARADGQAVRSE